MKQTKSQLVARKIEAAYFGACHNPEPGELAMVIAEAIDKAVKSERRSCVRVALRELKFCKTSPDCPAHLCVDRVKNHIRTRGQR